MLENYGLLPILDAVAKVVVIKEYPKIGTVVLHGVPNTGKSTIMSMLQEIFICDMMQINHGNFDTIPETRDFKF